MALFPLQSKQPPRSAVVVDGDVQVGVGGGQTPVARGVADFGQCAPTRQRMADERVSPVVDRQVGDPLRSQGLAGGREAPPQDVTRKPPAERVGAYRADERIAPVCALTRSLGFPAFDVGQGARHVAFWDNLVPILASAGHGHRETG